LKEVRPGGGLGHSDKGEFKYVVLFFQNYFVFISFYSRLFPNMESDLNALLLLDYALTFDMVDVESEINS
jgi:hypothetical protein